MSANEPFALRLREARLRKSEQLKAQGKGRLSQEKLGVMAGIAEESASARMNQYEQGIHLPDLGLASRLADAVDVPLAYLFCTEDDLARLLLAAHSLSPEQRQQLLAYVESLTAATNAS